jgi:hypothetical protein
MKRFRQRLRAALRRLGLGRTPVATPAPGHWRGDQVASRPLPEQADLSDTLKLHGRRAPDSRSQ